MNDTFFRIKVNGLFYKNIQEGGMYTYYEDGTRTVALFRYRTSPNSFTSWKIKSTAMKHIRLLLKRGVAKKRIELQKCEIGKITIEQI